MSQLHLNDAKVGHYFGKHPERGKPFRWLGMRQVDCGIKWSQFQKKYVPAQVMVYPTVALVKVSRGIWNVFCEEQFREKMELWLIDHLR